MKAINRQTGRLLGSDVKVACSLFQRGLGLMGRSRLREGEGLLIPSCRAITTFFMRFPMDVIFLNEGGQVVQLVGAMRPWHNAFGGPGVAMVLELPAGTIQATGTLVGHWVAFEP